MLSKGLGPFGAAFVTSGAGRQHSIITILVCKQIKQGDISGHSVRYLWTFLGRKVWFAFERDFAREEN